MELLKKALEKNKCPFCGFKLEGKAGKVICEYEECLFVLDQSDVKELLGHNPFAFELKPLRCKENLQWTDRFGVVQTDTHDWLETENTETQQTLKCQKCGKESVATKKP
mgnify:CR=1 FL=1